MDVIDLGKVRRAHQRFLAEHSRAVDGALNATTLTSWAERYVRDHGGFRSRSGNLVNKTKVTILRSGRGKRIVRTSNDAPYAAAQDGGSGLYGPRRQKYLIRAKSGKALAFVSGGKLIFRRSVMHPGVKPTRFLYNANDALFRSTRLLLQAAMKRAAAKF